MNKMSNYSNVDAYKGKNEDVVNLLSNSKKMLLLTIKLGLFSDF